MLPTFELSNFQTFQRNKRGDPNGPPLLFCALSWVRAGYCPLKSTRFSPVVSSSLTTWKGERLSERSLRIDASWGMVSRYTRLLPSGDHCRSAMPCGDSGIGLESRLINCPFTKSAVHRPASSLAL